MLVDSRLSLVNAVDQATTRFSFNVSGDDSAVSPLAAI